MNKNILFGTTAITIVIAITFFAASRNRGQKAGAGDSPSDSRTTVITPSIGQQASKPASHSVRPADEKTDSRLRRSAASLSETSGKEKLVKGAEILKRHWRSDKEYAERFARELLEETLFEEASYNSSTGTHDAVLDEESARAYAGIFDTLARSNPSNSEHYLDGIEAETSGYLIDEFVAEIFSNEDIPSLVAWYDELEDHDMRNMAQWSIARAYARITDETGTPPTIDPGDFDLSSRNFGHFVTMTRREDASKILSKRNQNN